MGHLDRMSTTTMKTTGLVLLGLLPHLASAALAAKDCVVGANVIINNFEENVTNDEDIPLNDQFGNKGKIIEIERNADGAGPGQEGTPIGCRVSLSSQKYLRDPANP